jgi:predicted small secreted protein
MNLKKLFLYCCAALMISFLAACNTVEGLGKDVKKAGQSLENAASSKKTGD